MAITRMGIIALLGVFLLTPLSAEEPTFIERIQSLLEARKLSAEASDAYKDGRFHEAASKLAKVVEHGRRIHPKSEFPEGTAELATALNKLGAALLMIGDYEGSKRSLKEALDIRMAIYPASKREFKNGHPSIALTLFNLGVLYRLTEDFTLSRKTLEQALEMEQGLATEEGKVNFKTMRIVDELGTTLMEMGELVEARRNLETTYTYRRKRFDKEKTKGSLADVGLSATKLAGYWLKLGNYDKAEPLARESSEALQRAYPVQHPGHTGGLHLYAAVLSYQGKHEAAAKKIEDLLAIAKKAKWPDSPLLAVYYNNAAFISLMNRDEKTAIRHSGYAVRMLEKLYPEKKYPDGTLQLADFRENQALIQYSLGDRAKAESTVKMALGGKLSLIKPLILGLPEHQALMLQLTQGPTEGLDLLLTVTQGDHDKDAEVYKFVWGIKSNLSQVLERRQLASRIGLSKSNKLKASWQQLLTLRGQIAYLLLNPDVESERRDELLPELTRKKERVETEIADLVPQFKGSLATAKATPAGLGKLLSKGAVFVDFLHYDRVRSGKERVSSYAAFLTSGSGLRRIELGPARPIDTAIQAWRQAIIGWNPPAEGRKEFPLKVKAREELEQAEQRQAAVLRDLVWKPIEDQLPKGTETLYLAPDHFLARLPWAALPGKKKNTILLEDFIGGVIQVPSGPFLFDRLKESPPGANFDRLLLVGGVAYDAPDQPSAKGGYPPLKGTLKELVHAKSLLSDKKVVELTGGKATAVAVARELPRSHVAHVGTHAFFLEEGLLAEFDRLVQVSKSQSLLPDPIPAATGIGLRHPLAFSGLVFAGANHPKKVAHDEWLLSSETIVQLPLDDLRLLILSACETGLGARTTWEGTQGLIRAVHVAGCPRVVGTLWSIDDVATAALMSEFYHQLISGKKSPQDALRSAQLKVYYRPDLVPALAGLRGPIDLKNARREDMAPLPKGKLDKLPPRTHPKLWAAFFLSGVGW